MASSVATTHSGRRARPSLILLTATGLTLVGLAPSPALAVPAESIWDGGAGDGLWSSAGNWSGDVLPGPETVVRIEDTADVVRVDVDTSFSGGGQLHLDGELGVSPTLVVDSGVTLTLSGSSHIVRGFSVVSNEGTGNPAAAAALVRA